MPFSGLSSSNRSECRQPAHGRSVESHHRVAGRTNSRRSGTLGQRARYVRHVRIFTAFLGRSPDTATSEDLRRFQLHMTQQLISAGSINAAIAALRFFFTVMLERPDLVRPLTTVSKPRKAPVVLSQEGGGASPRSRARPQVQGRAQRRRAFASRAAC